MDARGGASLLVLSFLGQTDCQSLLREVGSLAQDLDLARDLDAARRAPDGCGGSLETDGRLQQGSVRAAPGDARPQVDLGGPGDEIDAVALRAVTRELREIADRFECHILTQATNNLTRKLSNAASNQWVAHLTLEVDWVVKNSRGFDLPMERVMMALALTLVKGVCEKTPRLLRSLFDATLQYLR